MMEKNYIIISIDAGTALYKIQYQFMSLKKNALWLTSNSIILD